MKKLIRRFLLSCLFLCLTFGMLLYPKHSLYFALTGLTLWFEKMIPALLPFMILTNLLIQLRLTDSFSAFLRPVLGRLFRLSNGGVYAVFVGFLCGFPMGAKVTADLYKENLISKQEGTLLLSFCNNIGPIYFTGFVAQVLGLRILPPFLFGMYGIPFLYGLFLCRHNPPPHLTSFPYYPEKKDSSIKLLDILDDSIMSGLFSILKLGGYMILFNLFNLLPFILFRTRHSLLYLLNCLLEITSGISRVGNTAPLLVLMLLPFGGFSCIAQTYSMIKDTDLSIKNYIFHKIILTGITALYYLFLFQMKGMELFL